MTYGWRGLASLTMCKLPAAQPKPLAAGDPLDRGVGTPLTPTDESWSCRARRSRPIFPERAGYVLPHTAAPVGQVGPGGFLHAYQDRLALAYAGRVITAHNQNLHKGREKDVSDSTQVRGSAGTASPDAPIVADQPIRDELAQGLHPSRHELAQPALPGPAWRPGQHRPPLADHEQ